MVREEIEQQLIQACYRSIRRLVGAWKAFESFKSEEPFITLQIDVYMDMKEILKNKRRLFNRRAPHYIRF